MPQDSVEADEEESSLVARSAEQLHVLTPKSILKVGGSRATQSADGLGSHSPGEEPEQGGDAGQDNEGRRRSLRVEFVGLAQSMPAELAAGVMEEMQRTRTSQRHSFVCAFCAQRLGILLC